MTVETWDNLKGAIGRHLTNDEWVNLISENFKVSKSIAKEMLHSMYFTKQLKEQK